CQCDHRADPGPCFAGSRSSCPTSRGGPVTQPAAKPSYDLAETQPRARSIVPNILVGLFSLFLALGAAEVAVRIVAPQQLILKRADIWKPRDTLGWDHRPNVNTTINTGERTVQVRTDSDGFRIGRNDPPAGGSQVLLIGDSFAEALQVE